MNTILFGVAYFRQAAERVMRQIVSHFKDHPAVIGYQIDNETFPTGVPTRYMNAAFLESSYWNPLYR